MKLTKANAARQLGISRTTLYKLIDQGKVSATPEGLIDQAELVRVAPVVDTLKERTRTPMHTTLLNTIAVDTTDVDTVFTGSGPHEHQVDTVHERSWTPVHEQPWTPVHERVQTSTVHELVDTLRDQVQLLRDELQAARTREQTHREELAWLRHHFDQMQQRYDRVLEAPRPVSQAPLAPGLGQVPGPAPRAISATPRGAMRRRILAVLREHPEGLSPVQLRRHLGADKSLAHTVTAMARDGLLQRVAHGQYRLP